MSSIQQEAQPSGDLDVGREIRGQEDSSRSTSPFENTENSDTASMKSSITEDNCSTRTTEAASGRFGCLIFACFGRKSVEPTRPPKKKKLMPYSSVRDLTDTFYEEKEPHRMPYDVPSVGGENTWMSKRSSQRHFREWL
jgi:hypothetical protein